MSKLDYLMMLFLCTLFWYSHGHKLCLKKGSYKMLSENQMCCKGSVEEKDELNQKRCCYEAGLFYYENHSLCCNNSVVAKYEYINSERKEFDCCNNVRIDKSTHGCCGGAVYNITTDNIDMMCCGKHWINLTKEICCEDEDDLSKASRYVKEDGIICCGTQTIEKEYQECRRDSSYKAIAIYKQEELCQNKTIKLKQQTCCGDKIYNVPYLDPENQRNKNARSACCGQTGYNPNTQECCPSPLPAGVVVPRNSHFQCCGSESVDTRMEVCCGGKAVKLTPTEDMCCGQTMISSASHGCCGGIPFKKQTHYCCPGYPGRPLKKGTRCCGGAPLTDDHLCCFGTIPIKKSTPDDEHCCYMQTKYTTFNNLTKACTERGVVTRIAPNDRVCGAGIRYVPDTAICCNDHVHTFPPGVALGCCTRWSWSGIDKVYSQATHTCCRGRVTVRKTGSRASRCCGAGDDRNVLCCGGQDFWKHIYGDKCCEDVPYFAKTEMCCAGKLYKLTKPKGAWSCCGQKLIQAKEHCSKKTVDLPVDPGKHQSSGGSFTHKNLLFIALCVVVGLGLHTS